MEELRKLEGSEKQIEWAEKIRSQKMRDAAREMKAGRLPNMEIATHNYQILAGITDARVWIETKNISIRGLLKSHKDGHIEFLGGAYNPQKLGFK